MRALLAPGEGANRFFMNARTPTVDSPTVSDYSKKTLFDFFYDIGQENWLGQVRRQKVIDILNISGDYRTKETILFADKIIFAAGARLTFETLNTPFLAIICKELIFAGNNISIGRDLTFALPKPSKPAKSSTNPGGGTGPRHGNKGGNGNPGAVGVSGEEHNAPTVLIASAHHDFSHCDLATVTFNFPGIDGGAGGDGGDGGDGGRGGHGRNGNSTALKCKRQPGDGGPGGDAGPGGAGGIGGDGSEGSDIYVLGSEEFGTDVFKAQVLNDGGSGGLGGAPGAHGAPGGGGGDGSRGGWCQHNARPGKSGTVLPGTPTGPAANGQKGPRGDEYIIVVPSVHPFFPS